MGNWLTQIEWLLKIILVDDDYRMQEVAKSVDLEDTRVAKSSRF